MARRAAGTPIRSTPGRGSSGGPGEARAPPGRARGKGGFRRATWDEALEIIAASSPHREALGPRPRHRLLAHPSDVDALVRGRLALPPAPRRREPVLLRLVLRPPERLAGGLRRADRRGRERRLVQLPYVLVLRLEPRRHAHARRPLPRRGAPRRREGRRPLARLQPQLPPTDWWIPAHAGQDGALWLGGEPRPPHASCHARARGAVLRDFLSRYTDAPFLVALDEQDGAAAPGRCFARAPRAHARGRTAGSSSSSGTRPPTRRGCRRESLGFRWQSKKGQWNLQMKDGHDGARARPGCRSSAARTRSCSSQAAGLRRCRAHLAARRAGGGIETERGTVLVATIYDLLFAQYGVARGPPGRVPGELRRRGRAVHARLAGEVSPASTARQVVRFAREWARHRGAHRRALLDPHRRRA